MVNEYPGGQKLQVLQKALKTNVLSTHFEFQKYYTFRNLPITDGLSLQSRESTTLRCKALGGNRLRNACTKTLCGAKTTRRERYHACESADSREVQLCSSNWHHSKLNIGVRDVDQININLKDGGVETWCEVTLSPHERMYGNLRAIFEKVMQSVPLQNH